MGFLEILLLPRINQFQWQYTPKKVVNTAGGLQMSSLSFAKFGLLYKKTRAFGIRILLFLKNRLMRLSLNKFKFQTESMKFMAYCFGIKPIAAMEKITRLSTALEMGAAKFLFLKICL